MSVRFLAFSIRNVISSLAVVGLLVPGAEYEGREGEWKFAFAEAFSSSRFTGRIVAGGRAVALRASTPLPSSKFCLTLSSPVPSSFIRLFLRTSVSGRFCRSRILVYFSYLLSDVICFTTLKRSSQLSLHDAAETHHSMRASAVSFPLMKG